MTVEQLKLRLDNLFCAENQSKDNLCDACGIQKQELANRLYYAMLAELPDEVRREII